MKKNAQKTAPTVKYDRPGRPMYNPVIPRGKFTMTDFCTANGVNPKTGKGKQCSKLTLIKFLGRKQGKALVMKVKGETTDPNSKSGLGRKAFLYTRRAGVTAPKSTIAKTAPKATRKTRKAKDVTVNVGISPSTANYEAQKAALLAPTPAVVTPAPAPTPADEPVAATLEATPENSPVLAPTA